jgi:hypothetical protein
MTVSGAVDVYLQRGCDNPAKCDKSASTDVSRKKARDCLFVAKLFHSEESVR